MDKKTLKVSNQNTEMTYSDRKSQTDHTVAEYSHDEQTNRTQVSDQIMEAVVKASNLERAYKQVKRNKGSPGVDNMTVDDLGKYLILNLSQIKKQLLLGTYKPSPIKRVEIPKPDGGMRQLGIPTVVDRFIQQAVGQVLNQIYDSSFSESSFGFRPRRSAQDAIKQSKRYVEQGYKIVVDIDLEKIFDKVQHDVLMNKLKQKIKDARLLKLIRRYLKAGIMINNETIEPIEGTPQGGPLSPLLSNIILDNLDKELEKRGHKFCRYADDCNIYIRTKRSGERVMKSVTKFISEKLELKVNKDKSTVAHVMRRKFLGYTFNVRRKDLIQIRPHNKSVEKFKVKVKSAMRKGKGQNIERFIKEVLNPILRGWHQYFKISDTKRIFEDLDKWIRRRIRSLYWRQLKNNKTRFRKMVACGIKPDRAKDCAGNGRGRWWNSKQLHMSELLPTKSLQDMGLYCFVR